MGCDNDITLVVDGELIPANKMKLATCSPYFHVMFNSHFREKNENHINIQGVSGVCLRSLVGYSNNRSLQLHDDSALQLLEAASLLQFDAAQRECLEYLHRTLNSCNAFHILCTADRLLLHKLTSAALCNSLWYFNKVYKTCGYLEAEVSMIVSYLDNPTLHTDTEYSVFEAIIHWLQHDKQRKLNIVELLKCLRFSQLTVSDIQNMLFYSEVQDSADAKMLLESVKCKKQEFANTGCDGLIKSCPISGVSAYSPPNLDKIQRCVPTIPCMMGHLSVSQCRREDLLRVSAASTDAGLESRTLPCIFSYNMESHCLETELYVDKLTTGVPNFTEVVGYCAFAIGKDVYVVGGETSLGHSNWNDHMWKYNTFTNTWTLVTRLPTPRRHCSVCVHEDNIYIIGGFGKHRIILSSIDVYNLESDSWSCVPPLPCAAYSPCCCIYANTLYIFHTEVHMLDLTSHTWSTQTHAIRFSQQLPYIAIPRHNDIILLGEALDIVVFTPDSGYIHTNKLLPAYPRGACLHDSALVVFCASIDESYKQILQVVVVNTHTFTVTTTLHSGSIPAQDFNTKSIVNAFNLVKYNT